MCSNHFGKPSSDEHLIADITGSSSTSFKPKSAIPTTLSTGTQIYLNSLKNMLVNKSPQKVLKYECQMSSKGI